MWKAHSVGQVGHARVAFVDHGDHRAAAGFDFFEVRHHLVVHEAVRNDDHAGRMFVDQGDRPVLHFGRRITFGMDVADFLELQRAGRGNNALFVDLNSFEGRYV